MAPGSLQELQDGLVKNRVYMGLCRSMLISTPSPRASVPSAPFEAAQRPMHVLHLGATALRRGRSGHAVAGDIKD